MEKPSAESQKSESYNVSTISIFAALKSNELNSDEKKYTILDTKYVYHDIKKLGELYLASRERIQPKFLVAFKSDRLFLHEIIVAVSTSLQLDDEKSMQDAVKNIYKLMKEVRKSNKNTFIQLRNTIRDNVIKVISKFDENKEIPVNLDELKILETYNELIQSFDPSIDNDKIKDAIIEIVTDKLYQEQASNKIAFLVDDYLKTLIQEKKYSPIQTLNSANRYLFMVAGGQASGKGSSVAAIKYNAKQQGIDWSNVIKINTDSYKLLLLDPATVKPEFYSQLSQEEASLIHIKIHQKLEKVVKEKKAPHIFVDQVFVGKDKLELVTSDNNTAAVIVVSTEVSTAIERSYDRGKKEGRYEHTEGILACHRNMVIQMPEVLKNFIGKHVNVAIMDNNVPLGKQPILIMEIDLEQKLITVHDHEKVNNFIKKMNIKSDAKSPKEVYSSTQTISLKEYLEPLLNVDNDFKIFYKDESLSNTPTINNLPTISKK